MPIQKAHFSAFITRLCQSFHQLIKRFVKLRNAFFLKLPSHYIDIYAKLRQYLQNSTRPNEIVFNANLWFAMLTISVHSFNWYCIYSIHSYKRPNVLIKVPATAEGLKAIQQLISEGININVTLLFGLPRYRQVAEAYIAGIEARLAKGKPVGHVASVASFFVSRIDTLVDSILEKIIEKRGDEAKLAKQIRGQVAIASAKAAYQIYKEIFSSDRYKKLAEHGVCTQRLLWASTGTKNAEYSDVKYIETLIGVDTVNTVPVETMDAYREHGEPKVRIEDDFIGAGRVLQILSELGINIDIVTRQLEEEGVAKFNKPFDELMETLAKSCNES